MTPRGGLDRGGMGVGGRRPARSGWTRRICAESRSVSDRAVANNEEETKHRGRNRRQENAPAATGVRRSVIRLGHA